MADQGVETLGSLSGMGALRSVSSSLRLYIVRSGCDAWKGGRKYPALYQCHCVLQTNNLKLALLVDFL